MEKRSRPSRLIILTSAFPYDRGESFLETELEYLCTRFDSVVLVPYKAKEKAYSRVLPENVSVFPMLRPRRFFVLKFLFLGVFNTISWRPFLGELRKKGFFFKTPRNFVHWLSRSLLVRMMSSNSALRRLFLSEAFDQVIYSYWGTVPASFYGSVGATCPFVVRMHGVDIYEERPDNHGYIFGRRALLSNVSFIAHISEHGRDYLRSKYPDVEYKSRILRLGVSFIGTSPWVRDGRLKLVTCSRIIPLKRLELLAAALKMVKIPVRWTHIGDGCGRETLEQLMTGLPEHISGFMLGYLSNKEMMDFYVQNPVDLFVNISSTEGVPVTVMEALSCAIPVLATDVGGTSELVDDSVGRLLPADLSAGFLASAIEKFASLSVTEHEALRNAAWDRWKERADALSNYSSMADFMTSLLRD